MIDFNLNELQQRIADVYSEHVTDEELNVVVTRIMPEVEDFIETALDKIYLSEPTQEEVKHE
jgi:hypothetical protein